MTRTATLRLLRISLTALAVLIIVFYAAWRSLNYARGPEIHFVEPSQGASIATTTVTVKGQALRVIDLHLNGNRISMDEEGDFEQTVVIFPGINTLSFTAADQFGRNTEARLILVGSAELPELTNTP